MNDTGKDLKQLRGEVDDLDARLLDLLNRRMEVVREIGRVKDAGGSLGPLDTSREREVLDRLAKLNRGPLDPDGLAGIFREVMSAARRLQRPTRSAYFGPEATFTHLAAMKYFGKGADLVPQRSIGEVFEAVEKGKCDYGVVPIENSTEGVVNYTLDLLYATSLKLCGEIYLEITHNLVSLEGVREKIERIYSHPQPIAQCREWLAKNMPNVPVLEAQSTAAAAQKAQEDASGAAITSMYAAQLYGLKVACERIEDNPRNYTRFALLGKQDCEPTGSDKTSVLFATGHVPGALYAALAPFAKRGINLTKLESRPVKAQAWRYIFFVDLEGHIKDEGMRETLEELRQVCEYVKLLGSYPQAHDQEKFAR